MSVVKPSNDQDVWTYKQVIHNRCWIDDIGHKPFSYVDLRIGDRGVFDHDQDEICTISNLVIVYRNGVEVFTKIYVRNDNCGLYWGHQQWIHERDIVRPKPNVKSFFKKLFS